MTTVTLNSNLTAESLVLEVAGCRSGLADCSFAINARIWDGDHEQYARVDAELLVLSVASLQKLRDDIAEWCESTDAGILGFAGDYSLAADGYSTLELTFCDRADTISSVDKPDVVVRFEIGKIKGEFSFITDQSCLRIFANDLNLMLTESAA